MNQIYTTIHDLFTQAPEMALFLTLALGWLIGKIRIGAFRLGGVAGSLLMALLISQFGVQISETLKNILFALFIFSVGYTSGPVFFRSFGKGSLREIVLAAAMAVCGLATVVLLARLNGLDKGTAAGIAAGGLTQTAIMGTAESAINSLGLSPAETGQLVANISVGYVITYIFGSFATIFICVNLLELFMGRTIREDALKAEAVSHSQAMLIGDGQSLAVPELTGRIFMAGPSVGRTVKEFEESLPASGEVTVERIKRGHTVMTIAPHTKIHPEDKLLIVGRRPAVLKASEHLGKELPQESDLEMLVQTREVVLSSAKFDGKTLANLYDAASPEMRHGLYLISLSRAGVALSLAPDTVLHMGDIFKIYGAEQDVKRAAAALGHAVVASEKTDFVYLGLGILFGLLIGKIAPHVGHVPLTLGAGGGVLLSGLIFGWFRMKHMSVGALPTGASRLLQDFGMSGFVAIMGLNYGAQALSMVQNLGLSIFLLGILVTLIPLALTMLIGRYILRYDNVAVFAGALSGSRSANPAFGEVLNQAENTIPTTAFAVTYALANVFLTLLGPLVVNLT